MAAMQELLALVNRLQQACTLTGDEPSSARKSASARGGSGDAGGINLWNELPQIVVVGGQSSGKSSVLEAIVGRDFLPRGTGIVTRRPLLLQLVKTDAGVAESGEFLHLPGTRFASFDAMREEIERETERTCANKSVSPTPIQLTVSSPHVPNLTLVDMPGLTKIAVGDQPASITKDIEDMARMYIEGENAIILAVSPANSDLATSDAVKLASDVDPAGARTIGVLTKLDIMDDGTDARDVLTGKSMPLHHGWFGVVNRSQADINGKKNMVETRKKERAFFTGHAAYADLDACTGVESLSDKLCTMLQKKIVEQIPRIRDFLHTNIASTRVQLDSLGAPVRLDRASMFRTVLDAARRFENAYALFVDEGDGGGNAILRSFDTNLRAEIGSIPLLESFYTRDKVARTIDASDGWQTHLVAPEAGYRKLIAMGIDTLKEPSLDCVDTVHAILRKGIDIAAHSVAELAAFPTLRAQLETAALDALDQACIETKATVATMVAAEAAFIDADFFRSLASLTDSARRRSLDDDDDDADVRNNTISAASLGGARDAADASAAQDTEQEQQELQQQDATAADDEGAHTAHANGNSVNDNDELAVIGRTCLTYVRRVMRQQARSIPKAIVLKSVLRSKELLIASFYAGVGANGDNDLEAMLSEDPEKMKKRDRLSRQLELLTAAREEVASAGF